jgi:NAD-dependent deacetylase
MSIESEVNGRVKSWIDAAERIVVLTGAGISTDSGIADFRGPNGIWTKNPAAEKQADIRYYLSDPEIRKASWRTRLTSPIWAAEPNAGHRALVELERRGTLLALVTQNVDGLHQKAGSDPALVLEVHGTAHFVKCWSCGESAPMEKAMARVRAGEEDPPCRTCGGILKSATISFGQSLDPDVINAAQRAAMACDLLLAVGSTLGVYPAAGLVPLAAQAGARIVILNDAPTDFDDLADAVLRGSISDVLPTLTTGPGGPPRRADADRA